MRSKGRKSFKLPDVNERSPSYALHSINAASKGFFDNNKRLRLDQGFGDYNMRLFRLKDRVRYVKDVPSAFTPTIRRLLQFNSADPKERRIATEHNQQIQRILDEPKEVYLEMIGQEREAEERRRQQQRRRNQFVKGEDQEVREHNQHLTFNYLPKHQANQWFKVIDRSPNYVSPSSFSFNVSAASFSASPVKPRKKRGLIFLSDDKTHSYLKSKR